MEQKENIVDILYRQHDDLRSSAKKGAKVNTLTEVGMYFYFSLRKQEEPELLKNTHLVIDFDLEAGPPFSNTIQEILTNEFSKNDLDGINSYLIHRDMHTSSIIRENNTFLVVDSYNAYGGGDGDHAPILRRIREAQPDAKIYVLHDKTQNDYNNCRIIALENIIQINRFCENGKNLEDVIKSGSVKYFSDEPSENNDNKTKTYVELDIETIPVPSCIINNTQSVKMIEHLIKGYDELEKNFDIKVYKNHLDNQNPILFSDDNISFQDIILDEVIINPESNTKKLINLRISNIEQEVKGKIEEAIKKFNAEHTITNHLEKNQEMIVNYIDKHYQNDKNPLFCINSSKKRSRSDNSNILACNSSKKNHTLQ